MNHILLDAILKTKFRLVPLMLGLSDEVFAFGGVLVPIIRIKAETLLNSDLRV